MLRKYNYWPALLFILSILPAVWIGSLILQYGVNSPFLDDWVSASYIYRYFTDVNITFNELIAQHNESRPLFPRFIFIGLASLIKGDKRYEMLVILAIVCITSFNCFRLSILTIEGSLIKRVIILIILNILVFSPTQYENWLWGVQILVVMPMLCITTAILVSYSSIRPITKVIICICLATISTFSYANGIEAWIVIPLVIGFNNWSDFKQKKWLFIGWISGFVFNVSLYFYNYHKPPQHPDILKNVNPIDLAHYFFCFLGSAFAFTKLTTAAIVGIVLVITFIAVCAYLLSFRKDYSLWYRAIGWLSIALYALISALITSFGRVGFGVGQAMAARYTTFSLYLPIALIPLVVIIIEHSRKQEHLLKYRRILTGSSLILLTILLCLHTTSANIAVKMMVDWRAERLQGKACLMFINVLNEEKCINEKVFFDAAVVKKLGNKINSIGFLNPPLITANKIQDMQWVIEGNTPAYGWIDNLKKVNNNEYMASGWAVLPQRHERADAVILTYKNSQNEDKIFALSDTIVNRQDVVEFTNKKEYASSGWKKIFSVNRLPKGKIEIEAWGFDTDTSKAYKLNGSHIIQNQ